MVPSLESSQEYQCCFFEELGGDGSVCVEATKIVETAGALGSQSTYLKCSHPPKSVIKARLAPGNGTLAHSSYYWIASKLLAGQN